MDYTSGSNALVIASDNLTKSQIVEPFTNLHEELKDFDLKNFTIFDGFTKAYSVINNSKYRNMICAISGGSDSDIVLDIVYRCDISKKVRYIWINTGLEYQATKNHIKFLEEKYSITIEQFRGMPIPLAVRKYKQSFSKYIISIILIVGLLSLSIVATDTLWILTISSKNCFLSIFYTPLWNKTDS